MDKAEAIAAVVAELEIQLERMTAAARDAGSAASDPENKAENKYDTRGLESSYLAAGQAEQAESLATAVSQFAPANFPEFTTGSAIAPGALVEVELAGSLEAFLLAPAGGGLVVEIDGTELTVLTPDAPLRGQLIGLCEGDSLERPPLKIIGVA